MLVIVQTGPCYTEELITGTPVPQWNSHLWRQTAGALPVHALNSPAHQPVTHNIILRPTPDFGKEWKSGVGRKINLWAIVAWMNILIWFCSIFTHPYFCFILYTPQ